MHLPRFSYLKAASLEEAATLLNQHPDAALMAGGTDLLPRMKYRLSLPGLVVSLKGVPAAPPSVTPEGDLLLDPLMTLSGIARSAVVRDHAPLLAEAALGVASREIRNMGTLGGNLCQQTRCLYYNQSHGFQFVEPCYKRGGDLCYFIPRGKKCWAVFMADTAPALISLGARITITGPDPREIPLEEFYTGKAEDPIDMNGVEVLSRISVPKGPPGRGWAFLKSSPRGGLEFATLNVAVVLEMDGNGQTCRMACITVGAVGAAPIRALKAETMLVGEAPADELFAHVAEEASTEIRPVPHHGHSRAYLGELLKAVLKEALGTAFARSEKETERNRED